MQGCKDKATVVSSSSSSSWSLPLPSSSSSSLPPPSSMLRGHKGESYARELRDARMRGSWDAVPTTGGKPAKGEHHAAGSLPEIIRRLLKHNPGSGPTAEVASAEYELRAFLQAYWSDVGWSARGHASDFARPGRVGHTAFAPPVPQTGHGLGWGADKYAGIISNLEGLQRRASNEVQRNATTPILAYALFNAGRDEDAVLLMHEAHFIESLQIEDLRGPGNTDNYDVALLTLGFIVYGMANERLHHRDPEAGYAPFAFAGYARAIDLHEAVRGGQKSHVAIDEIERWGELALYRNALFSVREADTLFGLNALRAYQSHTARWPATFRPTQRAVIYRTYLEVLNRSVVQRSYAPPPLAPEPGQHDPRSQIYQLKVIQAVACRVPIASVSAGRAKRGALASVRPGTTARSVISRTVSTRRPHRGSTIRAGSLVWDDEVFTIAHAVFPVVGRSSDFPHAGQTNLLALELADALMTSWKLSGQDGGFVADDLVKSLYSMARITFDSHLISRSLVEALAGAEQYEEAHRALKLYIELVEKTREAVEAEKRNARRVGGEADAQSEASVTSINKFDDHDDSETYARTLLHGAHVLGTYLHKFSDADKLAQRALKLIETDEELQAPPQDADQDEKARYNELVAFVKRGAGVARAALAAAQTDPTHRVPMHQEALALLVNSAKLDDQAAETHYHLGRLQAQLHDIPSALASARKAVELEPAAIEPWHLLALLLSAKQDYKAALQLANVALDEAEADSKHDQEISDQEATLTETGAAHETYETVELRTELLSYDFPPARTERSEAVLQLLVTSNALEELVNGTAVAIDGQKDIFVYFHNHVASDAMARLGRTVKGPTPQDALSDQGLQIDTHPPGYFHRRGSRLASLLHHGPHLHHKVSNAKEDDEAGAYSTVTGLGQSGVKAAADSTVVVGTSEAGSAVAAAPPVAADPAALAQARREAGYTTATIVRLTQRSSTEAKILARLWLMSAATFRRAGQLADCRVAIQEAERAVPDLAGVWTQLGLYHAENDRLTPATNCLYKAIACEPDSIPAAVHLSRLLLSFPDETPVASANAAPSASAGVPAQSRSISLPLQENGTTIDAEDPEGSPVSKPSSNDTTRPTSLSLAEALLTSATAGSGWDVSEAWLYLGHVAQKTNRPDRAVECLKYALFLEQTKPVRPLVDALSLILPS